MMHQVLAGAVIILILAWFFVGEIFWGGGKPENGRDSLTPGGGAMPLW